MRSKGRGPERVHCATFDAEGPLGSFLGNGFWTMRCLFLFKPLLSSSNIIRWQIRENFFIRVLEKPHLDSLYLGMHLCQLPCTRSGIASAINRLFIHARQILITIAEHFRNGLCARRPNWRLNRSHSPVPPIGEAYPERRFPALFARGIGKKRHPSRELRRPSRER